MAGTQPRKRTLHTEGHTLTCTVTVTRMHTYRPLNRGCQALPLGSDPHRLSTPPLPRGRGTGEGFVEHGVEHDAAGAGSGAGQGVCGGWGWRGGWEGVEPWAPWSLGNLLYAYLFKMPWLSAYNPVASV
jgi:hypothetical protein